jgi:quercetin dioxygenase-like cupin family protein
MNEYTLYPFDGSPKVPFRFDGRILYASGKYELVHLVLQPSESMEPHTQAIDIVFFVIEGEGILSVGPDKITVTENTTVHVSPGVVRAWANNGNRPLRILVNKLIHQAI